MTPALPPIVITDIDAPGVRRLIRAAQALRAEVAAKQAAPTSTPIYGGEAA